MGNVFLEYYLLYIIVLYYSRATTVTCAVKQHIKTEPRGPGQQKSVTIHEDNTQYVSRYTGLLTNC